MAWNKNTQGKVVTKKTVQYGGGTAAALALAKAEKASGYKTTKFVTKNVLKGAAVGASAFKSIKDFGSDVGKTIKDITNPTIKKIPKSRRITAGPGPELDKTKLLGAGTGVDKPSTIHTPKPSTPVTRGQGGRPKPPKMNISKLTGGIVGEGKIGGRRIGTQTLNTTGMLKGPGTKTGSFKPNLTLDNKLMSDFRSIEKTKTSAKKRQTNLIKNAPGKTMQPGDTPGSRSKARDSVAKKVKASRKRTTNKVTNIQKGIDTQATQVSKNTGRPVEQVKKFNKNLSKPSGKDVLNRAYLGSRGIKPKVKLNAAAMLNPAGMAIDTALQTSVQKNPEKYTKGIFGGTVAKKSIPGLIAQTPTGKKINKRVSGLKSKIKSRFKF